MLPYFLRHYERFCKTIVVYDNGSDDRSREIVSVHPLCDLRYVDSGEEDDERVLLKVKGEMRPRRHASRRQPFPAGCIRVMRQRIDCEAIRITAEYCRALSCPACPMMVVAVDRIKSGAQP